MNDRHGKHIEQTVFVFEYVRHESVQQKLTHKQQGNLFNHMRMFGIPFMCANQLIQHNQMHNHVQTVR